MGQLTKVQTISQIRLSINSVGEQSLQLVCQQQTKAPVYQESHLREEEAGEICFRQDLEL